MFFSFITKNLNSEFKIFNFTTNFVTFKTWDGFKDEKFEYGGSLKNSIFRGGGDGWGSQKANKFGGHCLKRQVGHVCVCA